MFDVPTLNTSFNGLVGWRQSANPLYTTLNAGLLVSNSGLYFNGLSGIDFDLIEHIVSSDKLDVNKYLEDTYTDCLTSMLNKFVSAKKNLGELKELLENTVVQKAFDGAKVPNIQQGRAIGYEIKPKLSNNIKLQITSLGLITDSDNTVTVYLYRANKKTAIFTKEISNTSDNEDWNEVSDWIHYYQSTTEGAGQTLFMLIYEYDAVNQTANIQLSQNTKIYQTSYCDKNKYALIRPVTFDATYLDWNNGAYDLPDLNGIGYSNMTYGLNFRYNLKCDLTHILKDQTNLFAEALQYEVAIKILQDGFSTCRLNETENRMKDTWIKTWNLYKEYLYGTETKKGLLYKLSLDMSDLDNVCLPCKEFKILRGHSNY